MAIILNDSIRVQGGKPVEDKRLNNGVVYNSVIQANTLIAKTDRYPTLEVAIKIGGATFIYWYKEGIENSDLVLKQEGGGGGVLTTDSTLKGNGGSTPLGLSDAKNAEIAGKISKQGIDLGNTADAQI